MNDIPSSISFDSDVKPLFRASDRSAMSKAFDLWSFEDVSAHASQIAARLRDGSMPCDGPWPQSRVSLFEAWVSGGQQP
ncbi:MAG: hypothetical protein JWO63_3163 [Frankiales bacterium]|jgi:hypothetical protein|nr:hypothetical protein [Frankiales bacterium]